MKRGLIVDDATVMRMRLRDILQARFEVVGEAENGQRALELYAQLKPDFVTMDITMAEMNGMDALKNLMARHPEAKIVMVSAMGQKTMVFEALSQGARDFIIKPFDPDRVIMAINRLFD
jgi:two-component system chemotaxis response regulator CheY